MYSWNIRVNQRVHVTIERRPVTSLLLIYYFAQAECEDQRESNRSEGQVVFYYTDIGTDEQLASLSQINNNAPLPATQLPSADIHTKP